MKTFSVKEFAKQLIGNNKLVYHLVNNHFKSGHPIKALILCVYLFPVKRLMGVKFFHQLSMSCDYYNELQDLLHIGKVEGFELKRIGTHEGTDYIMIDDFLDKGIAYSFGIGGDVSWDKVIASKGYDIFMYDHTINGLPEENSRFHYFKKGIGSDNDSEDVKTLEYFISQNHHENESNMILKMDVEGAEWGFLASTSSETLSKFDQIVFELHNINSVENTELVRECLRKLNKTHQLVHVHPLNRSGIGGIEARQVRQSHIIIDGKIFPNIIEVVYVRREKYKIIQDYDVNLPLSLDSPAFSRFPDLELGHWNNKVKVDENSYMEIEYI